jgi:undecaprenyl-diphosphatase
VEDRPLGVVVAVVMVTRVYVGAHNPLDVICGAALGFVIGACLNLAFGVPEPRGE